MERVFKRKIYQQLLEWKETENGRTAILVEGARRVGKSTLVEQFAKNEYKSYILIDFNKASKRIKALFDDLMDIDRIFLTLQNTYRVQLFERKSVIIFDEVQKCPLARQAIKYLVKDGRYDYIETGSLISIHKNVENITIPSEEDRISMYPMDYEEFRWALGDTATMPLLQQQLDKRISLGDDLARFKMRELRLYMLVGGMPQAVNTYLDTNNLRAVDKTKRGIIKLYLEDFQKIDSTGNAERLFKNIPAQLSSNNSRYMPYPVVGQQTETKMAELLQDLEQSKTALICYNCTDPNVGMSATKDLDKYKILVNKEYKIPNNLYFKIVTYDSKCPSIDKRESLMEESVYYAFLELKKAMKEKGYEIDLQSGYRYTIDQEELFNRIVEEKGIEHTNMFVAKPRHSEHETGLAIDVCACIDGKWNFESDEDLNILFSYLHSIISDYGFILRYPKGKEDITGYGYEPWHLRYVGSKEFAKEIMDNNLTLEEASNSYTLRYSKK